jgi:RNA exonuclease 4
LLSHPSPLIRDTQTFKPLREIAKTKRPGLKKLVELTLGIKIQAGAHSSVTDARATMALYRLHKPEWESILRRTTEAFLAKTKGGAKRKRGDDKESENEDEPAAKKEAFPGGGRRGVSSGLGVIVKRGGKRIAGAGRNGNVGSGHASGGSGGGGKWWEESAS